MKILRKISLRRGLYRIQQFSPAVPKLSRDIQARGFKYKLNPQQQLFKYGVKPKFTQHLKVVAYGIGATAAILFKAYIDQMYKNQLDTIYRYRYHQEEISSSRMKMRMYLFQIFLFFEKNFLLSAFVKNQTMGKSQFHEFTEGVVRYGQYQHYINNKNTKFDFMDIGVLQKYPYAKRMPKQQ